MGNMIYEKDSDGIEKKYKYDQKGNKIYERENIYEAWYEYDNMDNLIHEKLLSTTIGIIEAWYEYTFHPNGKIKSTKGYKLFK